MVRKSAEKSYGGMAACTSSSELSENNPRQNFRLGDITWVKHDGSSWWPAQVIDEASVSSKAKKKTSHDALVRLYGTCLDLYVDPWKSNMEFEMFLKEENKTAMEAFHEVLQKELSHFKSPSDDEEEAVNTKAKTSTKKVRKLEGLEQDQEVRSNAKGGGAAQKGKKQKGVRQASALDKALSIDSAEGLRDKTPKQASAVRDKKSGKKASSGASVAKKEGSSKRSGRTNLKEYSDAAEDSTSQLHDTSASENAAEAGDMTSADEGIPDSSLFSHDNDDCPPDSNTTDLDLHIGPMTRARAKRIQQHATLFLSKNTLNGSENCLLRKCSLVNILKFEGQGTNDQHTNQLLCCQPAQHPAADLLLTSCPQEDPKLAAREVHTKQLLCCQPAQHPAVD